MSAPAAIRPPTLVELAGAQSDDGFVRPAWRGRVHLLALIVACPLTVVLAIRSDGARARAGVIVFAAGVCSMLAVSTTYHRWVHSPRRRAAWRRADHATIFAAIAGTFTALALVSLRHTWLIPLLVCMWTAASIGAAVQITGWRHADRVGAVMYIASGWAGVLIVPPLLRVGGVVPVALLLGGGLLYTVGAAGFSRRWPTLRPETFSYHEVWHVFTVAAAGVHLAALWIVATA